MSDCEFVKDCPRLAGSDLEFLKGIWTYWYCQGPKHPICAVKQLILDGQPIPDNIAPNGDTLTLQKQ